MIKKLLGLLAACFVMVQAYASVSVSPSKIEINANKVKGNYATAAIDVKGDSKSLTRLKVSAGYFVLNSKGELDLVDKETDSSQDLSKKIKFVPSEFNVLPGKSQKLRVNIMGIKDLPDGESRAVLYIEDVDAKEYDIPTGKSGFGAQLVVKTRVGVPIYVDKGNFIKKADLEYIKVLEDKDTLFTELKINSVGNSKVRCTGKIQIIKDKEMVDEYDLPGSIIGGSNHIVSKARIHTDKISEAGTYTIKAIISYDDEKGKKKNLTQETEFNIQENHLKPKTEEQKPKSGTL